MRGIKSNKHQSSKYVIISLYFFNKNIIIITSSRKIHIVDDLKINIFINMNIIISKKINIFISQSIALINNY